MKYGQSEFALTRATKELWGNKPASFTYPPRDIELHKYIIRGKSVENGYKASRF